MWFQASESAPRTNHGGMMFSTGPHNASTRRTTAELHNQDRWNKAIMSTNISEQTSCKCPADRCVPQDHTVQISQWSSLAPLYKQENFMSTKLVCKCPPEILVVWSVFITELYSAKMLLFSTQGRWLALSVKRHVDGFHHATHHLSTRTSQMLVVWCSSQKLYITNRAKIITGTSICARTRLDNIP